MKASIQDINPVRRPPITFRYSLLQPVVEEGANLPLAAQERGNVVGFLLCGGQDRIAAFGTALGRDRRALPLLAESRSDPLEQTGRPFGSAYRRSQLAPFLEAFLRGQRRMPISPFGCTAFLGLDHPRFGRRGLQPPRRLARALEAGAAR